MLKIILPINKADSIPKLLLENNITNYDLFYYTSKEQKIVWFKNEANNLIENLSDTLIILDRLAFNSFNNIVKTWNLVTAVIENEIFAEYAKKHNNARVLIFNYISLSDEGIVKAINIFLTNTFEGGRHKRRLESMREKVKC